MGFRSEAVVRLTRQCRDVLRRHVCAVDLHNIYQMPIEDCMLVSPAVSIYYRLGTYDDIERWDYQAYDYDEESKEYARERLQAGDVVVIGESNGLVVFYCWVCFGEIELGWGAFIAAPAQTAFVYKVFVVAGMRGLRVYPGVYGYLAQYLKGRGVSRVMTQAHNANMASNKSIVRCGYHYAGRYRCLKVLGFSRYLLDRELRRSLCC